LQKSKPKNVSTPAKVHYNRIIVIIPAGCACLKEANSLMNGSLALVQIHRCPSAACQRAVFALYTMYLNKYYTFIKIFLLVKHEDKTNRENQNVRIQINLPSKMSCWSRLSNIQNSFYNTHAILQSFNANPAVNSKGNWYKPQFGKRPTAG